jgi:DNA-binding CsgD family transcriptional regulator
VWPAVLEGAVQLVLVDGDAGTGKTRLVTEAARALHATGAAVLSGCCVAELDEPYQPFVEPVRHLRAQLEDGCLRIGPDEPVQGRPIVTWLEMLTGRGEGDAGGAPDRQYQRQLCLAAGMTLQAASDEHPLVLVVEDLHWAGSAGLQMLSYLAEHERRSRLLILATHRSAPGGRSAPLAQALARLQRLGNVQRLGLAPFTVAEIEQFLVQEAEVPPDHVREAALIALGHTGGNPFVLRELWRDLQRRGGWTRLAAPPRAPAPVQDLVQSRLDRLSAAARRATDLAAVVGEEFEAVTVADALDLPAEAVLSALDEAVREGVVDHVAEGDGRYRFPHALARTAVLQLSSPAAQIRDHARVAAALEGRPTAEGRTQRLAHHYASAHMLGYHDKAERYLLDAARLAQRALAHLDAARLFERAAAITGDPLARDAHRLQAARSYLLGGNFERARELAELVAVSGAPAHRLSAAIAFENASWRIAGTDRAVHLLRAALSEGPGDPSDADHVRVAASLGRALVFTGDLDESRVIGNRAIDLARDLGDEALLAEALQAGLWHSARPGHSATTHERAVELSALAERLGDVGYLGPAAYHRSVIAYAEGRLPGLEAAQADLVRVSHATGQDYFDYLAGCVSYARQFMAGRFDAAEHTCRALQALGRSFGGDETDGLFGVQTYMIRRECGALTQVRPLISGRERPGEHWAPGLLALYTEFRLDRPAAELLRWMLGQEALQDDASGQWPMVLVFMVEAALALGDAGTAARLRPALADYAGRNLVAGPFVAVFGSADRYLGAVDSLLGRGDPEEWFASAHDMDAGMRSPVHQAYSLIAHARHCRRVGAGERRAEEMLEQARAIAGPLGLARVQAQLGRRAEPTDGLTARELEVLRLLATGLNNRQIAAALHITENTAANHVRSILAKTGAANRTGAAHYAGEHGLLDRDH